MLIKLIKRIFFCTQANELGNCFSSCSSQHKQVIYTGNFAEYIVHSSHLKKTTTNNPIIFQIPESWPLPQTLCLTDHWLPWTTPTHLPTNTCPLTSKTTSMIRRHKKNSLMIKRRISLAHDHAKPPYIVYPILSQQNIHSCNQVTILPTLITCKKQK